MRLTKEQAAEVPRLYKAGKTQSEIARLLGVTQPAIWLRLRRLKLGPSELLQQRRTNARNLQLERDAVRLKAQLRAATRLIVQLQPSPYRRSVLTTLIMAAFELTQGEANAVVGLRISAGFKSIRSGQILIEMMKSHLARYPNHGFDSMFSAIRHDIPARRAVAIDLYRQYFKRRSERLAHRSIEPKPHRRKMPVQESIDQMWSIDFMQGPLKGDRKFWVLTAIDDCSREAVITKASHRRSAVAVIESIQAVMSDGRIPQAIRSDHGGEFTSKVYGAFLAANSIQRVHSRYRTPSDNAYIESLNKLIRYDVLTRFEFGSLEEAQDRLDAWRLHYNFVRAQKALGGLSPAQYAHVCRRRYSPASSLLATAIS